MVNQEQETDRATTNAIIDAYFDERLQRYVLGPGISTTDRNVVADFLKTVKDRFDRSGRAR